MASSTDSVSRAQAWVDSTAPSFHQTVDRFKEVERRSDQLAPLQALAIASAQTLLDSATKTRLEAKNALGKAYKTESREAAAGEAVDALIALQEQTEVTIKAAASDIADIRSHVAPSLWTRAFNRAEQCMTSCKKVAIYAVALGATTGGGAIGGAIVKGTTAAIAAGAGAGALTGVVVIATCYYGSRCYSYCRQVCFSR